MISLSANEVGGEGRGEVAFAPAAPHPDPLPALRCGAREEFPGVVKDFYKAPATCNLRGSWLPDMDLNHDKQIQSLLCYRYTIGQGRLFRLENFG